MLDQVAIDQLQGQVEKIKQAGALGRSQVYVKLIDYIAQATIATKPCSEMLIAFEVFNKDETFDVGSDSTVRVYIYNLRKKLDTYYNGSGVNDEIRLHIPKGEYRLTIEIVKVDSEKGDVAKSWIKGMFPWFRLVITPVISAVLAAVLTFFLVVDDSSNKEAFTEEQLAFWGGILVDDKPVMIVIGDYYIFGERLEDDDMRLVREFDINSESDLRDQYGLPDQLQQYFNMDLTYLPRGSAYALVSVQKILNQAGKTPRLIMMSEFSAEDLRANHVIYLGYLSGLSFLENYIFAESNFELGDSYDELVDSTSGVNYVSNFITASDDHNFVDYGVISSFSVVENNQMIILAGTRDAGVMEIAELAITANVLTKMQLNSREGSGYMSVVEVYGFNLTNVSAKLIGSEYIDITFGSQK